MESYIITNILIHDFDEFDVLLISTGTYFLQFAHSPIFLLIYESIIYTGIYIFTNILFFVIYTIVSISLLHERE
jgi:hypothetical protein